MEVESDEGMLSRYFAEMPQVNVNMPYHLKVKVLLLVVNWRSPYDTIKLLHEVPPVVPFKHGESAILK